VLRYTATLAVGHDETSQNLVDRMETMVDKPLLISNPSTMDMHHSRECCQWRRRKNIGYRISNRSPRFPGCYLSHFHYLGESFVSTEGIHLRPEFQEHFKDHPDNAITLNRAQDLFNIGSQSRLETKN
jgi:hypothetical protein